MKEPIDPNALADHIKQILKDRIETTRKAKGLSRKEVSLSAGRDERYLDHMYRKGSDPSVSAVVAIAHSLDRTVDYLVGNTKDDADVKNSIEYEANGLDTDMLATLLRAALTTSGVEKDVSLEIATAVSGAYAVGAEAPDRNIGDIAATMAAILKQTIAR